MARDPSPSPRRRFRLRFVRRMCRDETGATTIEFAFVAVPFFALLLAIIETAVVFWTQQVLETAVADASRRIYTGQFQAAHRDVADEAALREAFRDEICRHVVALFDCDGTLRVDVRSYAGFDGVTFGPVVDEEGALDDDAFAFEPSDAGQVVVVRAAIDYPIFTGVLDASDANLGNGRRLIMASAAFRNEPFGE